MSGNVAVFGFALLVVSMLTPIIGMAIDMRRPQMKGPTMPYMVCSAICLLVGTVLMVIGGGR